VAHNGVEGWCWSAGRKVCSREEKLVVVIPNMEVDG